MTAFLAARIGIVGAICVGLWFNGAYAWSKGDALPDRLGLLALSVDFCKVGFLPAASALWINKHRLPAIVLVVLWFPAIAFSMFSGYAAITSNRHASSTLSDSVVDARDRAEAAHQHALRDIAIAQSSPLWKDSAACTDIKRTTRTFCDNVKAMQLAEQAAGAQLAAPKTPRSNQELSLIGSVTGWPLATLTLIIAAWPALLIELVSSLGLYAVRRAGPANAPQQALQRVTVQAASTPATTSAKPSTASSGALAAPLRPPTPQIQWR